VAFKVFSRISSKYFSKSLFGFACLETQNKLELFIMSNAESQFFNSRWPVRLSAAQTAMVLNCQLHDISALTSKGLLTPLGNPPRNGKKFYETKAILKAGEDSKWLNKMTNAIHEAWRNRNSNNDESDGQDDSKMAA